MRILEVDQWTSTGNITDFSFEDFDLQKVSGGDSAAAKVIFGGNARLREVSETDRPYLGTVWFRQGPTGKLEKYLANYDSSD